MKPRIDSFSGAHGTGKSTAAGRCYIDAKYCNPKASVQILCDLEREGPYPINTATTEKAQSWIFGNQIQREMDALNYFDIVITDRTVIDVVAYTYVAGFHSLAKGMLAYAEQHIQNYRAIHFRKIEYNPYCHPDGSREVDIPEFRQAVENTMLEFYQQLDLANLFPGKIYYV